MTGRPSQALRDQGVDDLFKELSTFLGTGDGDKYHFSMPRHWFLVSLDLIE